MKRLIFLMMGFCCFSLSGPFGAMANATGPQEEMKTTVDQIFSILNDPQYIDQMDIKKAKIYGVVQKRFDFEEMAQRTLGAQWHRLDHQEKASFIDLFTRLLQKTYLKKVEKFTDEKVSFGDFRLKGNRAVVESSVLHKGVTTPIVYRMKNKREKWLVYDVVIEGVSLVSNYRNQFSSVLRKEKMQGLLNRLQDTVNNSEK